jgi:hypothetical protein
MSTAIINAAVIHRRGSLDLLHSRVPRFLSRSQIGEAA